MHRTQSLPLLVALAAALASPAPADAAKSTFDRYEVIADSRFTTVGPACPEGSSNSNVETTVAVTAGHEDEAENGTTTLDNDYLRFGIQRFECDGSVQFDRAFSEPGDGVDFTFTASLSRAAVSGTLTTQQGRTVAVNVTWTGLGKRAEVRRSNTTFPGFHGRFEGMTRDAVAAGTVVYDGETVVNGSTTIADLESLRDTNVTRDVPASR